MVSGPASPCQRLGARDRGGCCVLRSSARSLAGTAQWRLGVVSRGSRVWNWPGYKASYKTPEMKSEVGAGMKERHELLGAFQYEVLGHVYLVTARE